MNTQEAVRFLMEKGWSARDIEEALDGRVNVRSIYRWVRGERAPRSRNTMEALQELVEQAQQGRTP
jgi:hypothetical protein